MGETTTVGTVCAHCGEVTRVALQAIEFTVTCRGCGAQWQLPIPPIRVLRAMDREGGAVSAQPYSEHLPSTLVRA